MNFKLLFILKSLIALLFLLRITIVADDYSDLVISNFDEARSRIIMLDGNIYFHAGKDKNITFRVNEGSSILFGKTDLQTLPNSTEISRLYDVIENFRSDIDFQKIVRLTNIRRLDQIGQEILTLKDNFKELKKNLTEMMNQRKNKNSSRIKKLLSSLSENVVKIVKMIQTDDCLNQPCLNGGTCFDLVAKYQCLCPNHFEGKNCENRIDECALLEKIGIGCQNNGTCFNKGRIPGIFCHCKDGFHGKRCETKQNSCDSAVDLCGEHGHCISKSDGYKCLCEFGFKTDEDPNNPVCVDIDECAKNPCYPGAGCVNVPGSFKCSSCPPGLIGNGYHCVDFDECAEEMSNDCSKDPKVACLNTFGNYTCGPCPIGFAGDGRKCIPVGRCNPNPCHSLAKCSAEPEFACTCPDGFVGNGLGPDGCVKKNCTCKNGGKCDTIDNKTICECLPGFVGNECQYYKGHATVTCIEGMCGLNGACVEIEKRVFCQCDPGFYGSKCQFQQDFCGFHTHNETGVIEYHKESKTIEFKDYICQWSIQLFDTNKIIEFRFENFTFPKLYHMTSRSCRYGFANLTIYDGIDTDRPRIGSFCHGDNQAPDIGLPFYTSGNAAKVEFQLKLHNSETFIRISWKAVNPRCGGRYTSKDGTISYFDVHDEDVCAFYISVPPQYYMELTVKSVKMASGEFVNCTVNSLEVFDHQSASNRTRLIEICETQSQALIFRTTTNFATIYFKTDRKATGDDNIVDCKTSSNSWCGVGFVISYKSLELPAGCGGEIYPDESGKMFGYIESPNYGHSYFPNLVCTWYLNATSPNSTSTELSTSENARKIRIEFIDFDITTNEVIYASTMNRLNTRIIKNCGADYVRVFPRGGMFCNQLPPKGIYSSPYFEIRMVTDAVVSGRGFKLKYETVCEMDFTDRNGTISSPNFPIALNYPYKCTYRIITSSRHAIRVVFKFIGLKTDVNTCFYNTTQHSELEDYIEFSGGHNSNEQINRRYVCSRYPFVAPMGEIITSGVRPLSITYSTSGNTLRNTGFSFDYEISDVGCGGIFVSLTGVISSPNFPERYQPHMYCVYDIIVDFTKNIRLTFDVFDLENVANQEGCGFDSVQVYDGIYVDENNHGELLGLFCGMALPPSLISTGNKLSLVFLSDRSVNGAGFSANYRAVSASDDCDQTFTASSGVIEFNATKHPRVTGCDYVIQLPQMHRIMIKFDNVSIPCIEGSIMVRNGIGEDSPAFADFPNVCGTGISKQLITHGNRAFIRFRSSAPSRSRFTISYEQFTSGCGGRATGISGMVSAPQYPRKDSKTLLCEWTITVGEGNRVKLSFPFIDNLDSADTRGNCNAFAPNYIDIYEGVGSQQNLLKRYCTQETGTAPMYSSSNSLTIKYAQHGGSYHGALFGFLAHFSTDCENIILTDFQGSIQSPGYPGLIETTRKMDCKWTIKTAPGSRIAVTFHRFSIDKDDISDICQFENYLTFNSAQINETASKISKPPFDGYKFCGTAIPYTIISKNNTMSISYKTLRPNSENVFWLSYTTLGCGGTILKNNSRIFAIENHFVSKHELRECHWSIKAPVGFLIKVDIVLGYFMGDPEGRQPCDDPIKSKDKNVDGIEFTGTFKKNSSGFPQKIFCGIVKNQTFISQGNEIFALMKLSEMNEMSANGTIFDAKVTFVKMALDDKASCGGIVELNPGSRAVIQSPNFPKIYPKGIKCVWEVRAPFGHQVVFELVEYKTASKNKYFYEDSSYSTACSATTSFIEGSLRFLEGSYDAANDNSEPLFQVCLDLDKSKTIPSNTQNATMVFQGTTQDINYLKPSDENNNVGFLVHISAKCGGTLVAIQEQQTFIIDRTANGLGDDADSAVCNFRFVRNEEDDEGDTIYITVEQIPEYTNNGFLETDDSNNFTLRCGDTYSTHQISPKSNHDLSADMGQCDDILILTTDLRNQSLKYVVTYGVENRFCGGIINAPQRIVDYKIEPNKPSDCEWSFVSPPGFLQTIMIKSTKLPFSEDCQDSFIEVKTNSTAKTRFCQSDGVFAMNGDGLIESQNITVRLRYRPSEEFTTEGTPSIWMTNMMMVDRNTKSPVIESSKLAFKKAVWILRTKRDSNNTKIRIDIEKLHIPTKSLSFLELKPLDCVNQEDCQIQKIQGYLDDEENPRIYFFNARQVQVNYESEDLNYYFRLRWAEINEEQYQSYLTDENGKSAISEVYTCGGELIPTFEPQILENPKNVFGKYDDNMQCQWKIKKPLFSNIVVTVLDADLEMHPNCRYDFVGISLQEVPPTKLEGHHEQMMTYCNGNRTDNPMTVEYNLDTYIYFVSDRSRSGQGFKIQYQLGCKSYEYIGENESPLSVDLTNPRFPEKYAENLSCFWGIILGSTRQIKLTADIDIEGSDGICSSDYLWLSQNPNPYWDSISETNKKRCGRLSFEEVFHGRVFIYFVSGATVALGRHFKIHLEEILIDCSNNNLWIDELNPSKQLTSPEFPKLAPNSLNCHWVINTIPGHRIKFTVDPHTFNLQNSDPDECVDDYLEIRDGPAETSPLIGKYCETYAPSTIFSTASSLFVKFTTDSYSKSLGFNATYEIASCGGSLVLRPGRHEHVQSPNFPDPYPQQGQCEWTVKAPPGHFVNAKVNHIWMNYSDNCTADYVMIRDRNATGDILMPKSCSKLDVNDNGYQSRHDSMFVEFLANATSNKMTRLFCSNKMCGFDLDVSPTEFQCGGDITDDQGIITLPGYPNKIIQNIDCEWHFDAGIENRYLLEFAFENEENGYYMNSLFDHCYPDLEVWNGPTIAKNNLIPQQKRFCQNETIFISMADLLTLSYQDKSKDWMGIHEVGNKLIYEERFYKPWKITYRKINNAFNKEGCSSLITRNVVMKVGNMTIDRRNQNGLGARSFCHLRILRKNQNGTTMLQFSEINSRPGMMKSCTLGNRIVVNDPESLPWPIDLSICNSTSRTNETTLIYPNPKIELYVINNPQKTYFDVPLEFKLTVKFSRCGGVIDDEEKQTGVITSPNFGDDNVYPKNDYCLWYIKAPEGQIVHIEINFMDIENNVECKNDYLEIAEGQGLHSVIHRYCSASIETLPDRFKVIRSHGRDLTLLWRSDDNIQRKGFLLTYSFVHFHADDDPGCGFSSHAKSGQIMTPNFPKDYPNLASCVWNLVVPFGYNIKLTILSMDIQNSRNCEKDSLQISQEHLSRAFTPLNEYYFYFEHEENLKTLCGNDEQPVITTSSNRVRVNFTTDASISGRGFSIKWEAICGTTMTLTHGVITSPHYPDFYPNENSECDYLIFPILPDNSRPIVTLRVLDFNLEPYNGFIRNSELEANITQPCRGDFLEIIDVNASRSVMKLCNENMGKSVISPPVSIYGAIGVKFVSNKSYYETGEKKNYRGFKLSYAVADCGGEIILDDTKDKLSSTIYSPGFPLPYHHNLDCIWNITAPEGRIISAKFVAVEIESNNNDCNFDFIELFDSIVTNFTIYPTPKIYPQNYKFMGRFCGEAIPKDYLVTSGSNMTVRFKSDHSNSKSGFKLTVTATLGPVAGCGGDLIVTDEEKTLTPPLDGRGKYFNFLRCLWKFKTADANKVIEFTFTQIHLEERKRITANSSSCYDFVAIYDGTRSMSSFLLPPTCKVDNLPFTLQSSYRLADVYFESDSADSYDGFSVNYKAVEAICGGYFDAESNSKELAYESARTLTRTNQRHKRCRWHFYAKDGEPLSIDFKSFRFPSDDPTCPFEFMEIRDVGVPAECQHPACGDVSRNKPVLRYCGSIPPGKYISTTSVVQITTSVLLQSQYSASFVLNYQILDECNRTITIRSGSHFASGRLTSPNFPNLYDNNATCITKLLAPQESRILIVFKTFKLERGENSFSRMPGVGRFNNWRWRYFTPSSRITISDITPPPNLIYLGQTCSYDSLKIVLNPVSSNETKEFCGYVMPPSLLTTSDELTLILKSDTSMAHGGYELSYFTASKPFKESRGDKNVTVYNFAPNYEKTGVITPIGYPQNYPNRTAQLFTISPPSGLLCKFTIVVLRTSMDVDKQNCTDADHLLYYLAETKTWVNNKAANNPQLIVFPCVFDSASPEFDIPATKGQTYFFVFISDANDDNNGLGFRINWECKDYEEEIL